MRKFIGDWFGRNRAALSVAVVLLGSFLGVSPNDAQTARTALVLQLEGIVGPALSDYILRGMRTAAERNAPLIILQMDTPGGLDTSMRDIIRGILGSPVPVATYVSPSGARAASAGTYILYASHIAAMAPGTNLGAATPIQIGDLPFPGAGEDKDQDAKPKKDGDDAVTSPTPHSPMEAKAINDATAYIRSLAELRGRNVDWAEKAVREAASLSSSAALKENVIDILATSVDDLLAQANGRKVSAGGNEITLDTRGLPLEQINQDWRTELLMVITNPNVALILMMIGIYGLIFEFMAPGSFFPGTIGAICLLIGLYALAVLPVNFAGLGLIILGLAMMASEAFVTSFGVLGIGGVIAFIFGATILIDTDVPAFRISWPLTAGIALTSLALSLIIIRLVFSSHNRPVVTGSEEMVRAHGEVLEWRGRQGHVLAHGERWAAISETPLKKGQQVRVAGIEGIILKVEPDQPESN
ncbi:NfeD family protein [Phyllobacterium zundukense]|nr:nodulation protein NfeD [Phyllobacterium zundukense]ATU93807.1 nodulation protein NfeD [Phyllobacterium zundukense]